MKLSDELKHCLDGSGCGNCECHEADTKFICRGLLEKAYERIKGYDELEEQCIKENSWCLRMLLHKWKEFIEDIHELYEYRELKEQGKLRIFPCNVGDTVYRINKGAEQPIIPLQVMNFKIFNNDLVQSFKMECIDEWDGAYTYKKTDIGRDVFITIEQAESALQKINEMDNKGKSNHCKLCGKYIEKGNLSVCDECANEYKF